MHPDSVKALLCQNEAIKNINVTFFFKMTKLCCFTAFQDVCLQAENEQLLMTSMNSFLFTHLATLLHIKHLGSYYLLAQISVMADFLF